MGTFNFRQNKNDILYILDEDIKMCDITEEEEKAYREAGNYEAIYDYDYARGLYDDIEEDIHNGLNSIWNKYADILQNDDNYITYDEFMEYIYINNGYYEGFSVQLEDEYIDDVVLNNKAILSDIVKLYKNIYNDYAILRKGKTSGWCGVTISKGDVYTIYE